MKMAAVQGGNQTYDWINIEPPNRPAILHSHTHIYIYHTFETYDVDEQRDFPAAESEFFDFDFDSEARAARAGALRYSARTGTRTHSSVCERTAMLSFIHKNRKRAHLVPQLCSDKQTRRLKQNYLKSKPAKLARNQESQFTSKQ